jgi:hypothetical protein
MLSKIHAERLAAMRKPPKVTTVKFVGWFIPLVSCKQNLRVTNIPDIQCREEDCTRKRFKNDSRVFEDYCSQRPYHEHSPPQSKANLLDLQISFAMSLIVITAGEPIAGPVRNIGGLS